MIDVRRESGCSTAVLIAVLICLPSTAWGGSGGNPCQNWNCTQGPPPLGCYDCRLGSGGWCCPTQCCDGDPELCRSPDNQCCPQTSSGVAWQCPEEMECCDGSCCATADDWECCSDEDPHGERCCPNGECCPGVGCWGPPQSGVCGCCNFNEKCCGPEFPPWCRPDPGECCDDGDGTQYPVQYTCTGEGCCCYGASCDPEFYECCPPDPGEIGEENYPHCCLNGEQCCRGSLYGNCCPEGFLCHGEPGDRFCCEDHESPCMGELGNDCCQPGEQCCNGSCCPVGYKCHTNDDEFLCCPLDDAPCVDSEGLFCCDGECHGTVGSQVCCDPDTQQFCLDDCCSKDLECCGDGTCCNTGACLRCGSGGCEPMEDCSDCGPDGADPMPRCVGGQCSLPDCDVFPAEVGLCPGGSAEFQISFTCTNPCPADESISIAVEGSLPPEITSLRAPNKTS